MTAVLVLPTTAADQQGPVAALLSTAGWAAAAERVVGQAWIVGHGGLMSIDEARRAGSAPHLTSDGTGGWHTRLPTVTKTLFKDGRQVTRGRSFRVDPNGPWDPADVTFVWQRHELFHTAGIDLARAMGRPSVLFVPATAVWEAERWGVRRPGWRALAERFGERPSLARADLVACGSEEVADQARRIGTPDERILITPTGVDLARFPAPAAVDEAHRARVRAELGLPDGLVVGWVGSFRPFHAVQQLVEAVAGLEGVSLLLVGDGPERPRIAELVRSRGVTATFTGTVAHEALPDHLAVMDVAAVLAPLGGAFHYSPLKLAEYLAAGVPVVVPDVGPVTERLTPGVDSMVVTPGEPEPLRAALVGLRDDAPNRRRMGAAGRATAEATWSWDHQVRRVVDALGVGQLT